MNNGKIARRPIIILCQVIVALAVLTPTAKAWNNVGHRTIAELAWRQMDNDERNAISELLKQHPHYKEILTEDVPKGVSTNEWAFLMASIWPDRVRPAKRGQPHKPDSIIKYDLYPHGIGHPFLRKGDTNTALIKNFHISKPNSEEVLAQSIATLKNKNASAHDRAVSLCWVLHLFGDLHQPLHTANLVTKEEPTGMGLGGHCAVLNRSGKQTDLHEYWDQLPGVTPTYKTFAELADKLTADPELKPELMKEYQEDKTIAAWVQEGYRAAVDFAYSEDHIKYVREEDLKSGKVKLSAIPQMSADYEKGARKIAYRRVVLAGQRLTDTLKQVW